MGVLGMQILYSYFEKGYQKKKNAHSTIQEGNVEYDQYAVPDENLQ